MMWALTALVVILAALVLWSAISPQLPSGLRLPGLGPSSGAGASTSRPLTPSLTGARWNVVADAQNVRVSREFLTPVTQEAVTYYPPTIHLSCYTGRLYVWLRTGVDALADPKDPATVLVQVNGGRVERWVRAERTVLIAPRPSLLLQEIAKGQTVTISLSFGGPKQHLKLRTDGFHDIAARLAPCQPP